MWHSWLLGPGCPVSDPGGDPLDERGEAPTDDGRAMLSVRPLYGSDQTLGPVNEVEAVAEHRAEELGLQRTPSGGWRQKR